MQRPGDTNMSQNEVPSEVEEIPETECRRLLALHRPGRLAVTVDGQPEIFPLNYAMDDRVIVFRTAPGAKLTFAPMSKVAFEIDEYDPSIRGGWSVLVKGIAEDITGALDRISEAARKLPVSPLAPGQREHWLAVRPSKITGRRFRLAGRSDER